MFCFRLFICTGSCCVSLSYIISVLNLQLVAWILVECIYDLLLYVHPKSEIFGCASRTKRFAENVCVGIALFMCLLDDAYRLQRKSKCVVTHKWINMNGGGGV